MAFPARAAPPGHGRESKTSPQRPGRQRPRNDASTAATSCSAIPSRRTRLVRAWAPPAIVTACRGTPKASASTSTSSSVGRAFDRRRLQACLERAVGVDDEARLGRPRNHSDGHDHAFIRSPAHRLTRPTRPTGPESQPAMRTGTGPRGPAASAPRTACSRSRGRHRLLHEPVTATRARPRAPARRRNSRTDTPHASPDAVREERHHLGAAHFGHDDVREHEVDGADVWRGGRQRLLAARSPQHRRSRGGAARCRARARTARSSSTSSTVSPASGREPPA